jgi:hypothetical protein
MTVKLYAFTCGTVTGEFAHLMEGGEGDITVPVPVFWSSTPRDAHCSIRVVRGVGDVGSAVAAVLFHAGYRVALHDEPGPTTPRRGMAFTDAVFDGVGVLDGLSARRVESPAELRRVLTVGAPLPVAVWAFAEISRAADWSAVIDARMR